MVWYSLFGNPLFHQVVKVIYHFMTFPLTLALSTQNPNIPTTKQLLPMPCSKSGLCEQQIKVKGTSVLLGHNLDGAEIWTKASLGTFCKTLIRAALGASWCIRALSFFATENAIFILFWPYPFICHQSPKLQNKTKPVVLKCPSHTIIQQYLIVILTYYPIAKEQAQILSKEF